MKYASGGPSPPTAADPAPFWPELGRETMTEPSHIVRFSEPVEIDGVEVEEQPVTMYDEHGDVLKLRTDRETFTIAKDRVDEIEPA